MNFLYIFTSHELLLMLLFASYRIHGYTALLIKKQNKQIKAKQNKQTKKSIYLGLSNISKDFMLEQICIFKQHPLLIMTYVGIKKKRCFF